MKMRMRMTRVVCLSFLLLLGWCNAAQNDGVYIVYMGASVSKNGAPRNDHALLLNSLIKRFQIKTGFLCDNNVDFCVIMLSITLQEEEFCGAHLQQRFHGFRCSFIG